MYEAADLKQKQEFDWTSNSRRKKKKNQQFLNVPHHGTLYYGFELSLARVFST